MFANDVFDSQCWLGIPITQQNQNKEKKNKKKKGDEKDNNIDETTDLFANPCKTRVGGKPVWHDSTLAPEEIFCNYCGKKDKMLLVAQIYAPIADMDRSLYIFCCNTRACSLQSIGWRVIRNQKKNKSIKAKVIDTITPSIFDNSSLKVETNTSIWSFLDTNDDESLDNLTALLEARDSSLISHSLHNNKKENVINQNNNNKKIIDNKICSIEWKSHLIEEIPEQYWSNGKNADDDDDEEEFSNYENKAISDDRIAQLLESYMTSEEDPEIIAVLKNQKNKSLKKAVDYQDNTQENITTTTTTTTYNNNNNLTKDNSKSKDKDNDGDNDGKYSRDDENSKVEDDFQKRVSIDSRQVLRYAYGGIPLWCTLPFPTDTIPSCALCGFDRVFEMQLMPALLSLISNSEDELKSNLDVKKDNKEISLSDRLGHGLDYGVVAVYSCPNSCDGFDGVVLEEVCISQPPSDIRM